MDTNAELTAMRSIANNLKKNLEKLDPDARERVAKWALALAAEKVNNVNETPPPPGKNLFDAPQGK